jgi:hypothetical protein
MLNVTLAVRLKNEGGEVYFKKRDFGVSLEKTDIIKSQKVMKNTRINDNLYKNKIKKLIRLIEESQNMAKVVC